MRKKPHYLNELQRRIIARTPELSLDELAVIFEVSRSQLQGIYRPGANRKPRGGKVNKLNLMQRRVIRSIPRGHVRQHELAALFGVRQSTINQVINQPAPAAHLSNTIKSW